MTVLTPRPGLIDRLFASLERTAEASAAPDSDAHFSRAEARRLILECDPQACGSELGAQFLMLQFPREF